MKFKFCGDNDCQDWILAQIVLFSKLTSIKFKLILNSVTENILTQSSDISKIVKYTNELKFTEEESRGIVAALDFIIRSSTINSVDEKIVLEELQQLGLPKEHSSILCKVYAEKRAAIGEFLKANSLKFCQLDSVSFKMEKFCSPPDFPLELEGKMAVVDVRVSDKLTSTEKSFYVAPQTLDHLIAELREAKNIMERYEQE